MQPEVSTILLAAGLSTRMGQQNKLLLPVGGVPMIAHLVSVYREATDGAVLVVTGHETDAVEAALKDSGARTVFNHDFARGQASSVVTGLKAAEDADMLFIGLGDQPLLTPEDLRGLIAAHKAADPRKISIPQYSGARGNPILVPASLRPRLLDDPKRPGCRQFTRAHADQVQFLNLSARGYLADVDTPSDYAALTPSSAEVRP